MPTIAYEGDATVTRLKGLAPDMAYGVTVAAVTAAGASVPSAPLTLYTPPLQPPAMPDIGSDIDTKR